MEANPRLVDAKPTGLLLRGPRPSSLEDLQKLHVKTIINLEVGWFELFHGRAYEEDQWAEAAGITLHHLPLSDLTAPSELQVKTFISMVHHWLAGGSVYFHCLHGVDRTGYMAAMYRIRVQGWSPKDAIDETLGIGFHKFPYLFWLLTLKNG